MTPAITIIIPMYNAEKYIGECLESILKQTFTEYEVIVVDDCSTDGSVEAVEKIAEKFNGKLKIVKREQNSGGPAIPRNIGLDYANGKYVTFLDNDDQYVESALEELYNLAEAAQAEVVHAERFYVPDDSEEKINANTKMHIESAQSVDYVTEPTLEHKTIIEKLTDFHLKKYWFTWNKLILRSFLIEKQIRFPDIVASDDLVFNFYCTIQAQRYLRIPNLVNIYRRRSGSLSHEALPLDKYVHKWLSILIKIIKYMSEFMEKQEFFKANPGFKYIALEIAMKDIYFYMGKAYNEVAPQDIAQYLEAEFMKEQGDNIMLMTYFFSASNVFRANIDKLNDKIAQQTEEIRHLKQQLQRARRKR